MELLTIAISEGGRPLNAQEHAVWERIGLALGVAAPTNN
jgi:hypothetical protein